LSHGKEGRGSLGYLQWNNDSNDSTIQSLATMAQWPNESIFQRGRRLKMDLLRPEMIPIVGIIAGTSMIVIIVVMSLWSKTRERELQIHSEMRVREMEHQRKMKELELEIEKTKAEQGTAVHA